MNDNFSKLFGYAAKPAPSDRLFTAIMDDVSRLQRRQMMKKRILIFSSTSVFSLAILIPLINMLWTNISESGFVQYLSLLFSDFKIIAANWEDYALSLLESLPVISLALVLISTLLFISSIEYLRSSIKIFKTA